MPRVATRVLIVDLAEPAPDAIRDAADVIRMGGLVAFPTETVYGLGANALDAKAVARIFEAKGRPVSDPLIVHIAALAQLASVAVDIPEAAQALAARFWPGPLTLALRRHPDVPGNVSANRPTVAVRMPDHPVARALIEAAGVPIAAPSANLFARPSPTTAGHVLEDLNGRIDLILDGGPTTIGIELTVVDLTETPPRVLRPGGIPVEALRELLPSIVVDQKFVPAGAAEEGLPSPGMLAKHYSPSARLMLFSGARTPVLKFMRRAGAERIEQGEMVGALVYEDDAEVLNGSGIYIYRLGLAADLDQTARRLFAGLRDLDQRGVDVILARIEPDQAGLGLAIRDRLLRAAEGEVTIVDDTEGES